MKYLKKKKYIKSQKKKTHYLTNSAEEQITRLLPDLSDQRPPHRASRRHTDGRPPYANRWIFRMRLQHTEESAPVG